MKLAVGLSLGIFALNLSCWASEVKSGHADSESAIVRSEGAWTYREYREGKGPIRVGNSIIDRNKFVRETLGACIPSHSYDVLGITASYLQVSRFFEHPQKYIQPTPENPYLGHVFPEKSTINGKEMTSYLIQARVADAKEPTGTRLVWLDILPIKVTGNYADAEKECASHGGRLLSVEEATFLVTLFGGKPTVKKNEADKVIEVWNEGKWEPLPGLVGPSSWLWLWSGNDLERHPVEGRAFFLVGDGGSISHNPQYYEYGSPLCVVVRRVAQ